MNQNQLKYAIQLTIGLILLPFLILATIANAVIDSFRKDQV